MKRKYFAIMTLGLAIAVVCIVGGFGFSGFWGSARASFAAEPVAAASLNMPSDAQVRWVTQLQPLLGVLAIPSGKPTRALPLTLFGERINDVSSAAADPVSGQPEMNHVLSLTLLSGNSRFCVIDGIFLAEGDQFDNGTAIQKIKNQKVLISKHNETKWIYLDDPFDAHSADQTHIGKGRS